jgi:hypothetical protein
LFFFGFLTFGEQDKNDALFFDAVIKGNMTQAKW